MRQSKIFGRQPFREFEGVWSVYEVSHISILLTFSIIWTLMGGWVNLCDAKKINSKYRFFPK